MPGRHWSIEHRLIQKIHSALDRPMHDLSGAGFQKKRCLSKHPCKASQTLFNLTNPMRAPLDETLVNLFGKLKDAEAKRAASQADIAEAFGAYIFKDGPPPSELLLHEFAVLAKVENGYRKMYTERLCSVLMINCSD